MENTEIMTVEQTGQLSTNVFSDPEAFQNLFNIGKMFASSSLVPQAYQGKPMDCAIACDMANWVTSEVLPQIRRTGSYQKRLTPEEMMRIQLGMVDDHENRIEHLEKTMTIDYGQQQELKKVVNKRVIEILGGKKAPAYKELSKKVFAECNHDIQDYFAVNSRNNIPSLRFENALEYVEGWNPSNNTILDVRSCNAGMGGAHGV